MRQEKLSRLLDISIGRTPSRSEASYWGRGHRWVSIRDLSSKIVTETKEQITDLAVKDARCKVVKKGTLLFSFKLTIGKMAFAGCDLFTNEAIAAFAIKNKKELNPEFLYYALQSVTYGGSNQAVMGKTLNLKSLAEIEIPVPPLDDQLRIAHLLGKVEGLIAQRKQHLQRLDDLLKSVFLEMFGDPTQNEKGWEQELLGGLVSEKIGYGIVQPGSPVEMGVPVIRVGDFIGTEISSSGITKVDEKISKKHRNSVLKGDEILLACVGATIGKVACVRQEHAGYNIVRATARIRPSNKVDRLFLLHYLLSGFSQNYYIKVTRAVGQPTLNIKQIEELPVTIPPLALQQEFSDLVEGIGVLKSRYQQSLSDLEALYSALSQQAFKGELDLSRVTFPAAPIKGEKPAADAVLAPITAPVINLPETDLLLPALQDRTQLAPLLRFWLEAYRTQLGSAAFSLERLVAAAQNRLVELHPDNDFALGASDYDAIKAWVFDEIRNRKLKQTRDILCIDGRRQFGNQILLRARRLAQQ